MNARLLSNATMQPLVKHLLPWPVSVGDYNSLMTELIDEQAVAADAGVTHVLCVFDSDTLLGDAFFGLGEPDQARMFVDALERFCAAHSDKVVMSTSVCCSTARIAPFAEAGSVRSVRAVEASLNAALQQIVVDRPNFMLVDVEPLYRRYGEDQLHSPAFWYSGRIRYTSLMFRVLAKTFHEALRAYEQKAKKVLIVDLDNTLWGGVLGDLGPHGIELSESGRGAAFRDFQRQLKGLKETGVLLAICSKNNLVDVDEVFATNPLMILRPDDFVSMHVNWRPKPENIIAIAEQLDLGSESFVFIDDSPVERAVVATALPEIAVPDFPERIEQLPRWFADDVVRPHFGRYRILAEDRAKTQQYRANERRRSLAGKFDLQQFIAELDIRYTVHTDDPQTIARASQLTQKTNQFNLTTLRCDPAVISRYVESPNHALVVLEYEDRFGTEGLVGLVMLDLAERQITNMLMSCRVIGRNVEHRLIEAAFDVARAHGLASLRGEYIPSRKNAQVASLYETLGFALCAQLPDGRKLYERSIA